MERSSISLEENKKNRLTLKKIKSIDKIHKTYLPKTSDSKLKKLPTSILKVKNTENSKIENNNVDPNNNNPYHYAASTTTLKNEPQEDVTNMSEATGMPESADLEKYENKVLLQF